MSVSPEHTIVIKYLVNYKFFLRSHTKSTLILQIASVAEFMLTFEVSLHCILEILYYQLNASRVQ